MSATMVSNLRESMVRSHARAFALVIVTSAACSSPGPVTSTPPIVGPGTRALGAEIACGSDADCDAGERCVEGACQLQRCGTQAYVSAPPLGARSYFAVDRELVVLDDAPEKRSLEGYERTNGSFAHPPALRFAFGGARIVDDAGGNFFGARPEGVVAALEGNSALQVVAGERTATVPVGFVPVAVAAGDIDGDGIDEAIAVSAAGIVAACKVNAAPPSCATRTVPGVTAIDLAAADVDGDGRDEPVLLAKRSGASSFLFVVNFDDAESGQAAVEELDTGHVGTRLSAGNIDREPGPAEIVVLEDGGYAGFASDTLRVFGRSGGKLAELGTSAVAKDAIDVALGDTDGDDKAEIVLLSDSGVELFDVESATSLRSAFKTKLIASTQPTRLTFADLDGDSPSGSLVGGAELVAGPVVPASVVVYPPYSRSRSDGTSQIGIGNRESKEEVSQTTVALRASLTLGYEAEFPGIAKVAVLGRVEGTIARTKTTSQSLSIGDRFTVDARPYLEGDDSGVVVLACACYHAYTYAVEDPAGRLGSTATNGKKLSMFVPVGGQTAVWSLKRYNALAAKLGDMPVVSVPYTVGDPASYPATMQTLAGAPIPAADIVSTTPKAYRVSDVARVGWQLDVGEKSGATSAATIGVGVRGQVRAAGIVAEVDVLASQSEVYTITVGREASFSGVVPPIRNDNRTPEDEHALYSYGFAPIVYRDRYATKDGGEGGFFVVTYSVEK